MAKKAKTNKSAAIREALKANPDKSAAEIAKEVERGTRIGLQRQSEYGKKPEKAAGKKRGRKPGSKVHAKVAAPHAAHAALDSAFEFVMKVGGLLHAEQLIAKLKSIKERL